MPGEQCPNCGCTQPGPAPVTRVPGRHIRVVTKQGLWFDMDMQVGFSMVTFVTAIKAMGQLINEAVYQPHDNIATIFVWSDAAPPKDGGVNLPTPTVPGTETKQ